MLKGVDIYSKKFNMPKLPTKTHPLSIYTQPQSKYFFMGTVLSYCFINQ